MTMLLWKVFVLLAGSLTALVQPTPPMLLVDAEVHPTVRVSWTDRDNESRSFIGTRPFGSDAERTPLGGNLEAFVAVGGTRLSKGAGHPRGAIVRVGFYKLDSGLPMFEGVTRDTTIEVALTGVTFNQPVDPSPASGVQHLKYAEEDLESCGLPGDAREQFNIASPVDDLNSRTQPGVDARLGVLSGDEGSLGSIEVLERDDGTIDVIARFRYPALRNLRDPWMSDLPGTFLEPIHFHIEAEVLPDGVEPRKPTPARN